MAETIIILAVAVLFILLVRHLPELGSTEGTPEKTTESNPVKTAEVKMPRVSISTASIKTGLAGIKPPTIDFSKTKALFGKIATNTGNIAAKSIASFKESVTKAEEAFKKNSIKNITNTRPQKNSSITINPQQVQVKTPEQPQVVPSEPSTVETNATPISAGQPPATANSTKTPQPKDPLLVKAEALFAHNKVTEAEKIYIELITKNPLQPLYYNRIGIIYLEQGNYEDAKDAFREAVRLEAGNDSAYNNLGTAYYNLERYWEAVEAYEKSIQLNNLVGLRYANLGLALMVLKEYERARNAFERAALLEPETEDYKEMYKKAHTLYEQEKRARLLEGNTNAKRGSRYQKY